MLVPVQLRPPVPYLHLLPIVDVLKAPNHGAFFCLLINNCPALSIDVPHTKGYIQGYILRDIPMALNIPQIKNAKVFDKQYKLPDAGGLYLLVHPNGSKYWRLKYRYLGREKVMAFGVYPIVSLKDARLKRDEAKKILSDSGDPIQIKKSNQCAKMLNSENSFNSIALEWWNNAREASKRWAMPIHNWRAALNHFMIVFEDRLSDHI